MFVETGSDPDSFMADRVHHINFIVRDLEAAVASYERILGMQVTARDHLESRGIESARFKVGETWIVLVKPVRPDTVPARHLEEHGEGFFLMSLEVDSLKQAQDRLGAGTFDGDERDGIENWRVIDIDKSRTFGAQLQLVSDTKII
jgi:methylmalonyl-CoA/ethylmalonyl-CoA epimerase